jgi:hypothetical protein
MVLAKEPRPRALRVMTARLWRALELARDLMLLYEVIDRYCNEAPAT